MASQSGQTASPRRGPHLQAGSTATATTVETASDAKLLPDKIPPQEARQHHPDLHHHNLDLLHIGHHVHADADTATQAPFPTVAAASNSVHGSGDYQPMPSSSSNSHKSVNDFAPDQVFTPPSDMSAGDDSQESHLLRISKLAAARDRLPEGELERDRPLERGLERDGEFPDLGPSRKRMADGVVKGHDRSSTSPVRGHSRNTSTVSMASTNGSRIGDLSAELRARLSYAMVKVNHGWHSNTIEEVESLASQAVSPSTTSSNSTLHGRHRSSASPRLIGGKRLAGRADDLVYATSASQPVKVAGSSPRVPTLAPPAPIRPQQKLRRNSNPGYAPAPLLSHSQPSPRTPAQPSSLQATPRERIVDPILFSPHQNVREQDAIETLLFMSSPGNSANMKHSFSPSQPTRHALPTSQPRKSLPSQRPQPVGKRVGFQKSPGGYSDMDIDSPRMDSPHGSTISTPRRRPNGLRTPLALPAGLGGSGPSKRRPTIGDDDIERMLDSAQADSSDDDEIQIPISQRRGHAGMVGI